MTNAPNRLTIAIAFLVGAVAATAGSLLVTGASLRADNRANAAAANLADARKICGENTEVGWDHDAERCAAIALGLCDEMYNGEHKDVRTWLNCRLYDGDWKAFVRELPE